MSLQVFFKDFTKIISCLSSDFQNLGTGIFTEHLRVAACQNLTKYKIICLALFENRQAFQFFIVDFIKYLSE